MPEPMQIMLAPDGMRIAYQRSGDGPPLVLVHGTLDDHHTWMQVLPGLQQHFTVYAFDRRGRGASGATDAATYAIEREFEDVAALVDSIGGRVHLLGHSYGALCGLEAALRTDQLDKLILYEPPFPIPAGHPVSPPGALAKIDAQLTAGDRESAVLTFARAIARLSDEVIDVVRASPAWPGVLAAAHTMAYEVRAVEGYVFDPERFRNMHTPTMLLMGSESALFLRVATQATVAALPNSQLVELHGQGHVANNTDPDGFLRTVIPFLTGQRLVRPEEACDALAAHGA